MPSQMSALNRRDAPRAPGGGTTFESWSLGGRELAPGAVRFELLHTRATRRLEKRPLPPCMPTSPSIESIVAFLFSPAGRDIVAAFRRRSSPFRPELDDGEPFASFARTSSASSSTSARRRARR